MRKVYLDDLPHHQYGERLRIDWEQSVGIIVKFEYDNIQGEIEIIKRIKPNKLIVKYQNKISNIGSSDLILNKIERLISYNYTPEFKYNVGETITTINRRILILEQCRNSRNRKRYKYVCLIDNTIHYIQEVSLFNGIGCPVCANRKIEIGFNDMWTTNLKLAKLLANPDDGYKYTKSSSQKVNWKCPNCGEIIKNKIIVDINTHGLSCPNCSDGISYPEKFMYNILNQLGIEFQTQLSKATFKWCDKYININMIFIYQV